MKICILYWILCLFLTNFLVISSFQQEDTSTFPSVTLQRIRNHRLSMLRSYVLESLGFNTPPQINQSRSNVLSLLSEYRSRKIVESKCYLPSCALPNRINETMWHTTDSSEMNLYFDIIPFDSSQERVVNATLKLRVNPNTDMGTGEPQRYVVTLNQYTKPLRRRKKTRLLGATLIVWSNSPDWLTFSVTEAAREWIQEIRKNNGFSLQIRGNANITEIFSAPDCAAHIDVECSVANTPFRFRGSHNAILEIFTEKSLFL